MPINMQVEYPKLQNENIRLKTENEKLLASNRELVELVKKIESRYTLEDGKFTFGGDGDQLVIDLQTAINNYKSI